GILKNTKLEFGPRYRAYQGARLLRDQHPELWNVRKVDDLAGILLTQQDMADFLIEDLRRGRHWNLTEQVLALWGNDKMPPVVRRAIVRFAVQNPTPRAAAFVEQVRRLNPDLVADIEEGLKEEGERPAGPEKGGK